MFYLNLEKLLWQHNSHIVTWPNPDVHSGTLWDKDNPFQGPFQKINNVSDTNVTKSFYVLKQTIWANVSRNGNRKAHM